MKTRNTKLGVIAITLLSVAMPFTAKAQDKVKASVGADIVSGYIWRGQDVGGVSLQPNASIAYKGLSLEAFRANQFLAAGIKPIFVFNDMFQFRSEFYGFVPIFPIKKNALNKAYYGKAFSRFEYIGEISVICQLPFGAISAYVNHYSSPKKEWNVGLTLGWQLFNYRFIE